MDTCSYLSSLAHVLKDGLEFHHIVRYLDYVCKSYVLVVKFGSELYNALKGNTSIKARNSHTKRFLKGRFE